MIKVDCKKVYYKLLVQLLPKVFECKLIPPTPEPTPTPEGENLDIAKVQRWLGDNYSDAKETVKMSSATIVGDKVRFVFDHYDWPLNADGGCDAIACMFYVRVGEITGGKFDWIRKGGQTVKGLENVSGGYHGHSMPAKDTASWFMFVSVDGKQRTNCVKAKWG